MSTLLVLFSSVHLLKEERMSASTTILITSRTIGSIKPNTRSYFLKESNLKDFGVKVNPSGSIKFLVEVSHCGRTKHKMIGKYSDLKISGVRIGSPVSNPHISQKICCKVGKHHVYFVTSPKAFSTYGQYVCECFCRCASYPQHFTTFRDGSCEKCGLTSLFM